MKVHLLHKNSTSVMDSFTLLIVDKTNNILNETDKLQN